ncbi:MAG: HAD family hydrolase [Clostridium sp.]|uniref:HAD family hydrolase n=1 Tax=Clostridium sp. TaxID=1506 RepID=UPI003D6D5837
MLKNKKVIFFDMGNTLLYFHFGKSDEEKDKIGLKLLTKYLKEFDCRITVNEVKTEFYDKWNKILGLRKDTLIEYEVDKFLNEFLKEYNVNLNHEQCIKAIDIFYSEYRKHIFVEEGVCELLSKIRSKGYKIGIISNSCRYDEVMINCFKEANIDCFIDNYTFSYYFKICKPRLEIFKKALEKMNISPKEAVMIGDNLNADIKPALTLGMTGIWLNKNLKENNTNISPHMEILSLMELNEYI